MLTPTTDQLRAAKARLTDLSLDEIGTLIMGLHYIMDDEDDPVMERVNSARETLNVLSGRPRNF